MNDSKEKVESQSEKFKRTARGLETDQSEEAFDRIVKKVAKKPSKSEKPADEK